MNRALIAVMVAFIGLVGLTGCTVPGLSWLTATGVAGPTGRNGPPGPSMGGGPHPTSPNQATVLSGGGTLTDNRDDSYVAWGSFLISGRESTVWIPLPSGFSAITDLQAVVTTAPGNGASWTLTVDKNGSATALSCSIGGAATTCNDGSIVAVTRGDLIDLRVTPFGTPALADIHWSAKLTP